MRLVVGGEIFVRQARGGISRIFAETLPLLCDLDPNLEIRIITDGRLRQPIPTHRQIVHRSLPRYELMLRPGRLFRPVVKSLKWRAQSRYAGPPVHAVWQDSFYSPPHDWSGPFAVVFHDLMEERYPDLFDQPRHSELRRRKRECARVANIVICNSRSTQRDVCEFYGLSIDSTCVITLAASPVFRSLPPEQVVTSTIIPRHPYILYVGNRSAYKNFDGLLTAYAAWPLRRDVDLGVVGAAWTPDEQQKLHELGLGGEVHLFQRLGDDALCQLYNGAAAFVYPSLYEGFGIPLLEAMACRCPIVASDIPSTREVAGSHPFYFQAEDVADLHRALDEALAYGRQPSRLDEAERHGATYTWEATARQLHTIYQELAGGQAT